MNFLGKILIFIFLPGLVSACISKDNSREYVTNLPIQSELKIIPGAYLLPKYINKISNKKTGVLLNQASKINQTHILDTLLSLEIDVVKIFTPEHGFRGQADAGEKINNAIDKKSGLPIISLYGKHKKPSLDDLNGLDVVLFDLQDVGVRFYTYISTLHYMMEACAEANVELIVLDRPNPNGYYVDGPVLDKKYKSFVGMHPVPIVYGLSIGEYAMMINGEKWLNDGIQCPLSVVNCEHYDHTMSYNLPIKSSPNLPNHLSILLYPSLCLFEGTVVSIGRGTDTQFQIIGHPDAKSTFIDFQFTPTSKPGAKYPKLQNQVCYGENLNTISIEEMLKRSSLDFSKLIHWYKVLNRGQSFWLKNNFIDKLAGTDQLRIMIDAGKDELEIRSSWQTDLEKYRIIRKKYLLYKDFD